jgi:hypothetical protein
MKQVLATEVRLDQEYFMNSVLHFQQNSRPTRLTQVLHSFALGEIRCKIKSSVGDYEQ